MLNRLQLILATTLATLSSTAAERSFTLSLNDVKCFPNGNYFLNKSCSIDKVPGDDQAQLNIEAQLKKAVIHLRIDYSVDLERPNKDSMSLFKITNLDGCTLMSKNSTMPLMKILREIILRYGVWPTKCPISADYKFWFKNIVLDPNYLPPFVPEAEFRVTFIMYDRKVKIWDGRIFGKVSHQRKFRTNNKMG